jgi:hypothetical protein
MGGGVITRILSKFSRYPCRDLNQVPPNTSLKSYRYIRRLIHNYTIIILMQGEGRPACFCVTTLKVATKLPVVCGSKIRCTRCSSVSYCMCYTMIYRYSTISYPTCPTLGYSLCSTVSYCVCSTVSHPMCSTVSHPMCSTVRYPVCSTILFNNPPLTI